MKNIFAAFFVTISFLSLARAEYIICDGFRTIDAAVFPKMEIDTPTKSIIFSDNIDLAPFVQNHPNFGTANLPSGKYKADERLSSEKAFTLDVSAYLDYACNYQGAFLVFESTSDTLKINVSCDGAPGFTAFQKQLSCTHY